MMNRWKNVSLAAAFLFALFTFCAATCQTAAANCETNFGNWSACDPCLGTQSRYLNITTPPHNDGFPCPGELVEHRVCNPDQPCIPPAPQPCNGTSFSCHNDKCISFVLVCNGDDDCGNNWDENDCENSSIILNHARLSCLKLQVVPYLDHLGSGFDIISNRLVGRVLDSDKFNGTCRRAYNTNRDVIYRLPANIDEFHFAVQATGDLSVKTYSSVKNYVDEKNKEEETKWDMSASVGGSVGNASAEAHASASYSHTETFKSIYKAMTAESNTLYQVTTEIAVAQFVIADKDLFLDGHFLRAITSLPFDFHVKAYFDVFAQYGVVYVHSGVLGGRYSNYYVYSKSAFIESQTTEDGMKECLKGAVGASFGGWGFKASFEFSHSNCKSTSHSQLNSLDIEKSATHKIVDILGGTVESVGALSAEALQTENSTGFQENKFQQWIKGVEQNPIVLRKTVRPVCDLILRSAIDNNELKYANCIRALDAYMRPHSPTDCRGCLNGGTPVNMNKACYCACAIGFQGFNCADKAAGLDVDENGHFILAKESGNALDNIKLITTGSNPPIARNPPFMNLRQVTRFESIMKSSAARFYTLASSRGYFSQTSGHRMGGYSIVEYDEYLEKVAETPINFTSITECVAADFDGQCMARDFDIDSAENIWLSLKILNGSDAHTSLYKLDKHGNAIVAVPRPCVGADQDAHAISYLATTCRDQLLVSCPYNRTASVKLLNQAGKAIDLTQFENFTSITSVQHFDGNLWFHTDSHQVGAFDIKTWKQLFRYEGPLNAQDVASVVPYTQMFIDFARYLIIGQAFRSRQGVDGYKFSIVAADEPFVERPIVVGTVDDFEDCASTTAYRGKLYLLCFRSSSGMDRDKYILVIDYLK